MEAARKKAAEAAARLTASLLGKPLEIVTPPAPVAAAPEVAAVIESSAQAKVEAKEKEGDEKAVAGMIVLHGEQEVDDEVKEGHGGQDLAPGTGSIQEER